MGKLLTRSAILSASDVAKEVVAVPEWGGSVQVRGLTGKERDEFEQASIRRASNGEMTLNMSNMRARLVAFCVVDEDGERLFSDEDIAELGKKSASALERVAKVAQRLSGMGEGAQQAASDDFLDGQN